MWDDYIQRIWLWKLRSVNLCTPTFPSRFFKNGSNIPTCATISNFISPIPRKSWGKIIAIRRKEYFREIRTEGEMRYKYIIQRLQRFVSFIPFDTIRSYTFESCKSSYRRESVVNFLYPVSKTFHIPCLSSDKIRNVLRIFFSYCKLHPPPILSLLVQISKFLQD